MLIPMQDFVYPEGVAYPVGGTGQEHFLVMETHYNNPNMDSGTTWGVAKCIDHACMCAYNPFTITGVVDSSGLRFYYTNQARAQNAGIMYFGHIVTRNMLVPPRTNNYTIAGICTAECTNAVSLYNLKVRLIYPPPPPPR
jgi:hypothetical protein